MILLIVCVFKSNATEHYLPCPLGLLRAELRGVAAYFECFPDPCRVFFGRLWIVLPVLNVFAICFFKFYVSSEFEWMR